ncbi:MAG TPA: polyketide cyclase [Acidimicrobiaceae bacterium]|nr:polyketide cyclase [Acidimicrobiaceae bacterium]
MNTHHITETTIEAPANLPVIRMTRDFCATPAQLKRAHLDPDLFVRWIGPDSLATRIDIWDARDGGEYRYVSSRGDEEYAFRGCFHSVSGDRLVQTFTFEGYPDGVSLDSMWFEELGEGITRMHIQSLVDSFEARDGMLASGMETGVNEGYTKLDSLLATGAV